MHVATMLEMLSRRNAACFFLRLRRFGQNSVRRRCAVWWPAGFIMVLLRKSFRPKI